MVRLRRIAYTSLRKNGMFQLAAFLRSCFVVLFSTLGFVSRPFFCCRALSSPTLRSLRQQAMAGVAGSALRLPVGTSTNMSPVMTAHPLVPVTQSPSLQDHNSSSSLKYRGGHVHLRSDMLVGLVRRQSRAVATQKITRKHSSGAGDVMPGLWSYASVGMVMEMNSTTGGAEIHPCRDSPVLKRELHSVELRFRIPRLYCQNATNPDRRSKQSILR